MFCSKCGEILSDGARRCPACGASQRQGNTKVNSDCDHPHGQGPSKVFQSVKSQTQSVLDSAGSAVSGAEKPTIEEMIQALREFFLRYGDFHGRSSRRDFWLVFVCLAVVSLLMFLTGGFLTAVWDLTIIIPSLALWVRRLHDTGRSGIWMFLGLVPMVGPLILLLLCTQPSTPSNQWGSRT